MGLAASQGRLLLLTARKSDLEFRAQQISQSRLVLAQQQELIAKKYADKTSNTEYKMKVAGRDAQGNAITEYVDLTYSRLTTDAAFKDTYRLVDANGKELSTTAAGRQMISELSRETKGGSESYLKYLLETGAVRLEKKETVDGKQVWQPTNIAGDTNFNEQYYTADDVEAKATYDKDMLAIKIKDQKLELDLKGIESQHKAVETEFESVQKVIQKNIEVSFKIFS